MDDDALLPLWKLGGRGLVRALTLHPERSRWSYLGEQERAARRASWSPARRAVLPVTLVVFWIGVLCSLFGVLPRAAGFVILLLLVPGAVLGLRDWLRDGREHDRRRSLR